MPTDEALRARIRAKPGTWLVTGAAGFIGSNLRAATVEDPAAVDQVYNIALGEMITLSQLYATLREGLARAIDWYAGRPPAAAGDWSNLQFEMPARAASRPS